MSENKLNALLDAAVALVIQELGQPPYRAGDLYKTANRLENFANIKASDGIPAEVEAVDAFVAEPSAVTTQPPAEEPQKRTRKSKEVPPAEKPEVAAAVESAKAAKAAAEATPGQQLLQRFPELAALTDPQDPVKVRADHATAFTVVTDCARAAVGALVAKGSAHGNPLAKAAARALGGDKIASVPPAKWGNLVDLYAVIRVSDPANIPDNLSSDDDAGYDAALKKLVAGVVHQAQADDEL
jgi:hypothetical protein